MTFIMATFFKDEAWQIRAVHRSYSMEYDVVDIASASRLQRKGKIYADASFHNVPICEQRPLVEEDLLYIFDSSLTQNFQDSFHTPKYRR